MGYARRPAAYRAAPGIMPVFVMRLIVKMFIFPVAAERFGTPLQLPTEPILRQQCTVAVAVVLLINLFRRLTLQILILIINTNIYV